MRLLALHGRYQNARRFAEKLFPRSILFEEVKKVEIRGLTGVHIDFKAGEPLELVCIDAPRVVEAQVNLRSSGVKIKRGDARPKCETRAWWEASSDAGPYYHGVEESLEAVQRASEGFDGLLGFSQGGSLMSLLLAKKQLSSELRFFVFCSAYEFPGLEELAYDARGKDCLHLFSPFDRMTKASRSRALAEKIGGKIVEHDTGHFVPVPWIYSVIWKTFGSNS